MRCPPSATIKLWLLLPVLFFGILNSAAGERAPESPASTTTYDGHWWLLLTSEEQTGFVNGDADCYVFELGKKFRNSQSAPDVAQLVSNFYRDSTEARSASVYAAIRIVDSLPPLRQPAPGGEQWKERHWYFDGDWWRQGTPADRLGFVEGFLACLGAGKKDVRATFSQSPAQYVALINRWYALNQETGDVDPKREDAKIAGVLFKFRDRRDATPAQSPAARATDTAFLPAGPFLFEPGAIQPTYMDAFDSRPTVRSPDGKAQVTVAGPAESLKAWVTVQLLGQYVEGLQYQVWPIERSVDVLWNPDSQVFALTDNRYANLSYVFVCGTNFRMGESSPGLGLPITDLTPPVRKVFESQMHKFYAPHPYETRLLYAKALRWIRNDRLLVGVSAMIAGPSASANRGIKEWNFAYLVDVPSKKVVGELNEAQLLSQYGIGVAK